jgi:hypothetical protein
LDESASRTAREPRDRALSSTIRQNPAHFGFIALVLPVESVVS